MKKILLAILLFPAVAFAGTGPVSGLLGDVVEVASYALALTLTGLLTILVQRIAAKFKVSIPEKWMDSANSLIDKGIHYAEEKGKQAIAKNETIDGSAKLNLAAGFVRELADDKKLKQLAEDQLKKLIEARLNQNKSTSLDVGTIVNNSVEAPK